MLFTELKSDRSISRNIVTPYGLKTIFFLPIRTSLIWNFPSVSSNVILWYCSKQLCGSENIMKFIIINCVMYYHYFNVAMENIQNNKIYLKIREYEYTRLANIYNTYIMYSYVSYRLEINFKIILLIWLNIK